MKSKHKKLFKHFVIITGFCLAISWVLLQFSTPEPSHTFDLEKELQALPEEHREAARSQWEALSEIEQKQAQKMIESLSEEQKQQAIKQLKIPQK